MSLSAEPEILRCTLTASLLQLKCLGQNLEEIEFMDKPDDESSEFPVVPTSTVNSLHVVLSALATLYILGALDDRKGLTKNGRDMASLPLEPYLARVVLSAKELGCVREVLDIVSVLSSNSKLFYDSSDQREAAAEARTKFRHPSGDHLTILNVVRSFDEIAKTETNAGKKDWCQKSFLNFRCLTEAVAIRAQLREVCERMKIDWKVSCGENEQPVLRSLVRGLVQNAAFLQPDGSYRQIGRAHV